MPSLILRALSGHLKICAGGRLTFTMAGVGGFGWLGATLSGVCGASSAWLISPCGTRGSSS